MRVTAAGNERHVLVLHDEPNIADHLSRLFEGVGFEVVTALTGFRAEAYLGGHRPIDVVVASWEAGGDVYRWALQRRYDLRDRFVFVGTDLPKDFDQVVAGRCLAVPTERTDDIVRIAVAAIERRRQLEDALSMADPPSTKQRLLLADDDPVLLKVIGDLLADEGFAVTRVESGREAIHYLERSDASVIVCDWNMDECNGAEVYKWIVSERPWLSESVVFLSDREADIPTGFAASRPMFRKGQDSRALSEVLREIVWQARRKAS